MEKISAVVMTYNEEKNIKSLMRNLKDCDEVIIADDGSTDRTRELAEKMGAKVYVRDKHVDVATTDDARAFRDRFGWLPKFRDMPNINNGSACRNDAVQHASNEWVYMPDADERVTWNFKALQKLMQECDQIQCMMLNTYDNKKAFSFPITKLFKKDSGVWKCRIHDVLLPAGKVIKAPGNIMQIEHLKKNHEYVSPHILPVLEYSVLKDGIQRDIFYLGREYYRHKQYNKAIAIFDEYLKNPEFYQETVECFYYKAVCLFESGKRDDARDTCMRAYALNPDHVRSAYLMAQIYQGSPTGAKWLNVARTAKNSDSLF
jgi:glycosyltransferase involved in cell wall biosynthesis